MEKRVPLCTFGELFIGTPAMESSMEVSQKLKTELPWDQHYRVYIWKKENWFEKIQAPQYQHYSLQLQRYGSNINIHHQQQHKMDKENMVYI